MGPTTLTTQSLAWCGGALGISSFTVIRACENDRAIRSVPDWDGVPSSMHGGLLGCGVGVNVEPR